MTSRDIYLLITTFFVALPQRRGHMFSDECRFFPFYIHVASMFECIVDKPKDLLTVKHHRHDRICGRGK